MQSPSATGTECIMKNRDKIIKMYGAADAVYDDVMVNASYIFILAVS